MTKNSDKAMLNYLKESNKDSTIQINFSCATSYRIIKYGIQKLDMKFKKHQTKVSLDTYKNMDLLNVDNWNGVEWDDFTFNFSIKEFCDLLELPDDGQQKNQIESVIDKTFDDMIEIQSKNKKSIYKWFIKAYYKHLPSDLSGSDVEESSSENTISFTFCPSIIGAYSFIMVIFAR